MIGLDFRLQDYVVRFWTFRPGALPNGMGAPSDR